MLTTVKHAGMIAGAANKAEANVRVGGMGWAVDAGAEATSK